jgi:hypothetical protein
MAPIPESGQQSLPELPEFSDEELKALLAAARKEREPADDVKALCATLIQRAAVIGTFDTEGLVAGLEATKARREAIRYVLDESTVVDCGDIRQFLLDATTRKQTLTDLGTHAAEVLDSWDHPKSNDPISKHLATLLRNENVDVTSLSTDELRTLVNAADWAVYASAVAGANVVEWRKILEVRELIQPLEHMVGEHFYGREGDLEKLRDHADIVIERGMLGRVWHAVANALSSSKVPLVIHGVGGIGKSTLMAKFIVEHSRATGERALPFVYLDFDRASVDPMDVLGLLSEVCRQIASQFPQIAHALQSLRRSLLDKSHTATVDKSAGSAAFDANWLGTDRTTVEVEADRFAAVLRDAKMQDRPFLLVLDTFEEVQARGQAAVDAVFHWVECTMRVLPSLRVVISGRAPVIGKPVLNYELGNLDRQSSLAWLAAMNIAPEPAGIIFDHVGGNPLSLQLALEVLAAEPRLLEQMAEKGKLLRDKLADVQIQGYLYTRILKQIKGPSRALAHPGLILRRITPEIIVDVIAPVVEQNLDGKKDWVALGLSSIEDARLIFDKFKEQMTLVILDDGALIHRREVRRVMLPMQKTDLPETFHAINQRAADYYRARTSPQDRIELLYHELMLKRDPYVALQGADLRTVRGLASAIDELPTQAALVLRILLGHSLTPSEIEGLRLEDFELHAFGYSMHLIDQGYPEYALTLLDRRKGLLKSKLLAFPRALANFQLVEWRETDKALERADEYAGDKHDTLPNEMLDRHDLAFRIPVERGFLLWYLQNEQGAVVQFERARAYAEARGDRLQEIEALTGLLAAGDGAARTVDRIRRFGKVVREIAPEQWRANLSVVRRMVFLGPPDERTAEIALQSLGLQLGSRKRIAKFLGDFAADLDADHRRRLLALAESNNGQSVSKRIDRDLALAELERECAAYLVEYGKSLALRIIPHLRGRFTPWAPTPSVRR